MRSETLMVDKDVVVGRLVHLEKHKIILYMVDFNPSGDIFENWMYRELGKNYRLKLNRLR